MSVGDQGQKEVKVKSRKTREKNPVQ